MYHKNLKVTYLIQETLYEPLFAIFSLLYFFLPRFTYFLDLMKSHKVRKDKRKKK